MFLNLLVFYWSFIKFVESTDLAAIYAHGVLHLTNVEKPSANFTAEDLYFKTKEFAYPVGLAYDPISKNIFIADLNDFKADVYSFSLKNDVPSVKKVVDKEGTSAIEGLVYDPKEMLLYWTDSYKNGIYSMHTDGEIRHSSFISTIDNTVHKPRGVTLDFCTRQLFWTERDPKFPCIISHNMINGTSTKIIESASNTFYQAVAFDTKQNRLIWAETTGDHASNSSCRIVQYSNYMGAEPLVTLEKCYPFSLTLDDQYIYWSDWAQEGIMRLSRTNQSDLIMLVKTPQLKTTQGLHNGAFGLVNLKEFDLQDCQRDSHAPITQRPFDQPSQAVPLEFTDDSFNSLTSLRVTYNRLTMMFIAAVSLCCFFVLTTAFLWVRMMRTSRNQNMLLEGESPQSPVVVVPTIRRKKLRSFHPFKQPGILARIPNDDGVRIDIEDCCHMTLCDTPCIKEEGKSFCSKNLAKSSEDKEFLLKQESM